MVGSDVLALAMRLAVGFDGDDPIELTWNAPEACPDAQTLLDEVDRFRIPRSAEPIAVRASVTQAGGGFDTTVEIDLPSGTVSRSLRGEDCVTAVKATALVIAVAIDPTAVLSGVETARPPPEPEPVPEGPPTRTEPEPVVPATDPEDPLAPADPPPPPPPGPRLAVRFTLGGGGATGLLPGFGPLGRARAELGVGAFAIGISADFETPRRAYVETLGELARGADVSRWGAGVYACGAFTPSIFRIPLCANVAGGLVTARGVRVENARTVAAPLWTAGASTRLEVLPTGPLGFYVGTQLSVPFARTSFEVAGIGQVYRSAPLDLGVELGVVLQFQTEPRVRGQ